MLVLSHFSLMVGKNGVGSWVKWRVIKNDLIIIFLLIIYLNILLSIVRIRILQIESIIM